MLKIIFTFTSATASHSPFNVAVLSEVLIESLDSSSRLEVSKHVDNDSNPDYDERGENLNEKLSVKTYTCVTRQLQLRKERGARVPGLFSLFTFSSQLTLLLSSQ